MSCYLPYYLIETPCFRIHSDSVLLRQNVLHGTEGKVSFCFYSPTESTIGYAMTYCGYVVVSRGSRTAVVPTYHFPHFTLTPFAFALSLITLLLLHLHLHLHLHPASKMFT